MPNKRPEPARPKFGKTDGSVIPRHPDMAAMIALSRDPADHRPTRRIEFIGELSPFDKTRLQHALQSGKLSLTMAEAARQVAARARTRAGGRVYMVEPPHQHALVPITGISKTYVFGPKNNYIQNVAYRDAELLLASKDCHLYLDLDALEPDQPKPLPTTPDLATIRVDQLHGDDHRNWERDGIRARRREVEYAR